MHGQHYLIYYTAIAWLMLFMAAMVRTRCWTLTGMRTAFGNRDGTLPQTPFSSRFDRAAANTLESLVLYAVLVLSAQMSGIKTSPVATGSAIFFWSRILYIPVYLAGIPYLRTAVWWVGIFGLGMILVNLI